MIFIFKLNVIIVFRKYDQMFNFHFNLLDVLNLSSSLSNQSH